MNSENLEHFIENCFLNGVCRHELTIQIYTQNPDFLNGVCRHEQL